MLTLPDVLGPRFGAAAAGAGLLQAGLSSEGGEGAVEQSRCSAALC